MRSSLLVITALFTIIRCRTGEGKVERPTRFPIFCASCRDSYNERIGRAPETLIDEVGVTSLLNGEERLTRWSQA